MYTEVVEYWYNMTNLQHCSGLPQSADK